MSRTGGKHAALGVTSQKLAADLDQQNFTENLTIEGLDLTVCANTFVGNQDIRGVSGGQRRRVTVGEMMQGQNPVACADEISTGLDAAVTYDIVQNVVAFAKAARTTRIISLLQPGPETFSLFDEVILLAKGYVIYAGPIDEVVDYFAGLGYRQKSTMDVADFLQLIPTPDGSMLFDPNSSPTEEHFTAERFAEAFLVSERYERISKDLRGPRRYDWTSKGADEEEGAFVTTSKGIPKEFTEYYRNSFLKTMKLNLFRHFTLWKRDKAFIIGKMFENIGMAVATGGTWARMFQNAIGRSVVLRCFHAVLALFRPCRYRDFVRGRKNHMG
jgi:ABC-type multidrug transport system ATPase subunit